MAMELIRFLAGALIILIPGVCLARALSLGEGFWERLATGSSLGLAGAVYLASIVSHFDLRWFFPGWGLFALICIGLLLRRMTPSPGTPGEGRGGGRILVDVGNPHPVPPPGYQGRGQNEIRGELGSASQIWLALILLVVGISRFALALPRVLPPGSLDPTFHLILARQIQITHHAIDRWPFAGVPLNYPTGSHTLLVILSALTGLPLHTIFKDLIPLLGVLTTAQLFVLARRITGNAMTAVYAAGIYGLWAWYGSIDYFRWGGLPNELAMLLFIAMLSVPGRSRIEIVVMAFLFASMVLVHHHVMVAASIVLAVITLWQLLRYKNWPGIATAAVCGGILDGFYLIPYAGHLSTFHSTGIATAGEPILSLLSLPHEFGYALTAFAAIGIVLCAMRKIGCHSLAVIAALSFAGMFIAGEYIVPAAFHLQGGFFTPSRFLSDLNYFLPIFAAGAIACLQKKLRAPQWIFVLLIFIAPIADFQRWIGMESLFEPPPQFIQACEWIRGNTPADTIVDNVGGWTTYLCWREADVVPMPISEPIAEYHPAGERIPLILAGKIPPEPPDLTIVAMHDARSYNGEPILWHDEFGDLVIQEWPRTGSSTTSSSSAAVTPAPKPPGLPPASAPPLR